MSRKKKKRLRKQMRPKPLKSKELDKLAWAIARHMTFAKRDTSNDNKIFFDGNAGCYGVDGKKRYCDFGWHKTEHCPYNFEKQRCHKWRDYDKMPT